MVLLFIVARVRWARGGGHASMHIEVSRRRMLKGEAWTKEMSEDGKGRKERTYHGLMSNAE